MNYQGCGHERYGHITYAQHGDDLMLANIFELLGIERPNYLDIGCNHPIEISNTYLLYRRGSEGVCVDANPIFSQRYKDYRPRDLFIVNGVSDRESVEPLLMFDEESGINTFSRSEADMWIRDNPDLRITKEIHVAVTTINGLVEDRFAGNWPDLINIDIEGLDFRALDAMRFVFPNVPKVICVETRRHEGIKMKQMLSAKGYFAYCRTHENLIFIHRSLMEKVY